MKKVLTIAGSDCSGGAGIQADLKTITSHKMYGMSAITALTAQNTVGVFGVMEVEPEFVKNQLDCIFQDIYPDAIKIGMVSNVEIIKAIARKLEEYNAKNIVVDPVMVSTSGCKLISDEAKEALMEHLFPKASVITPNLFEAEVLAEMTIKSEEDMVKAAEIIYEKTTTSVLIKGGHLDGVAADLLYNGSITNWYRTNRVDNSNTHGTGCTLSSAIACNIAGGKSLEESIQYAKDYITGALKANLDLGQGSGPLNHMFWL